MANHKQTKKRIRQTARRTVVNRIRRSRTHTYLCRVEEAISGGDKEQARQALRVAQPELMKSAKANIVHKNTVSRKLSRLSARIKAMPA